jgi:hypothetical protein
VTHIPTCIVRIKLCGFDLYTARCCRPTEISWLIVFCHGTKAIFSRRFYQQIHGHQTRIICECYVPPDDLFKHVRFSVATERNRAWHAFCDWKSGPEYRMQIWYMLPMTMYTYTTLRLHYTASGRPLSSLDFSDLGADITRNPKSGNSSSESGYSTKSETCSYRYQEPSAEQLIISFFCFLNCTRR